LGRWQDQRPLWLAGGLGALGLEIFSVLYFQSHLGLYPCEYCVQIRLAMVVIFAGAMFAAVWPKSLFFKLVGYVVSIGGAIWGLLLSARLESINVHALFTPNWFTPCRVAKVTWPLGLKLDQWWPKHFRPDGICGEDSQWFFLGFSMTQWLILTYLVILAGLFLMFASFLLQSGKKSARLSAEN
jgi:disulfide bond formation protein DsbB